MKQIGTSPLRKDALAKVTGRARYTADLDMRGMLHAKLFRSTIAHGRVTSIDITEALEVPGVVRVLTYEDCRGIIFPTAGHPYAMDPAHQDKADRSLLTDKIRLYGDEIAVVVAVDELTAEKAAAKIKVEYEELPFYLDPEDAMADGASLIHDDAPNNILGQNTFALGDEDPEDVFAQADYVFEKVYESPQVQHCHLENHISYAYKDDQERITVVSSTQIPHIARRIMAHAFDLPVNHVQGDQAPCRGRLRQQAGYCPGASGRFSDHEVRRPARYDRYEPGRVHGLYQKPPRHAPLL